MTKDTPLFAAAPQLKQHMRILRKNFGAGSKIGRSASNVEGAIENLLNPDRNEITAEFQRANLEKSIKRQLEGIARLMTE